MTTANAMRAAFRRTVAPVPRADRQRVTTRYLLEDPVMPRRNGTKSSRSLRRQADGRRSPHNHRAHATSRQRARSAEADRVAELLGLVRPVEEGDR